MIDSSEKKKLGSLIVEMGLIDNRDLGQALSIAQETSLPLGRVLVLSDLLSENVLQGVLRCQSLFKQNLLDTELAKAALGLVSKEQISIDDALFKLGWNPESTKDPTPLGELLIDAGYVAREQLNQALDKSSSSGLPFGRLLVLNGTLTESLLTGALNAQILVRDQKLSKTQAVEALKEAKLRQVSVELPIKEKGFYDLPSRSYPRLGELLLFCGVISQSDLVSALELGLMNKAPVGQVLLDSKHLTPRVLEAALKVQSLMAEQTLKITDARTIISAVKEGAEFDEALQEVKAPDEPEVPPEPIHVSLFNFLKTLGRIDDAQAADAFQVAKHNSDVLTQVLLISGSVDAKSLERAEKCRKLLQEKKLTHEHANIAFDYAERNDIDVFQALKELQWTRPDEEEEAKQEARDGEAKKVAADREAADALAESNNGAEKAGIEEKVKSKDDWDTLLKQAHQLTLSGKLDKALDARLRLLQIAEESKPERVINCLDAIASLHGTRRNFEQAEHYYLKSLELREKTHDPQKALLAEGYCNVGKIYYFQKKYPEAEEYARNFIKVIAENLGKDHPDVACGWQNLGNIFYVQGKYRQAQQAYLVGMNICQNKLGESHPATVNLKRSYSTLLEAIEESGGSKLKAVGTITGSWRSLPREEGNSLYDN